MRTNTTRNKKWCKKMFFPSRKTQKNTTTTTLLQKITSSPFVNIFNGFKTFAS